MGGVAILQPKSVLKDRLPPLNLSNSPKINHHPMKPRRNPNSNSTLNPTTTTSTSSSSNNRSRKQNPSNALVMGEVKILKRGEALPMKDLKNDLVLSSTDRMGPDPDTVMKEIKIGNMYAGSAFITSPPPSSLPLPAFVKKRSEKDEAFVNLCQILKLDLD